jgi:hypothetical protein
MANYLRAGALHDWTDVNPDPVSLAKEIEAQLGQMLTFPPDDKPEPRRELLIAIATGIVNHLANNAAAFTIDASNFPVLTLSITVHPS